MKEKVKRGKKTHKHVRVGETIKIEEVLPHIIDEEKAYHEFDSIKVRVCSKRLQLFKEKGVDCVSCGAKGVFFAIEHEYRRKYCHLNLYAMDSEGDEVLMTKDHILPKSKGGSESLKNLQPMCKPCNELKSDTIIYY